MTLRFGEIRFMWMFAGVPWGGASNDTGVVDNGNFQLFCSLFFRKLIEMRPALLYSDTLSVVSFSVIPKCMTSNVLESLFCVKLCFRAGLAGFDRATCEK